LTGCKPPPNGSNAPNGYALGIECSDFNISVFDTILVRRRAVEGFEEKPHVS
jgi:hypothetical protein